MKHATKNDQLSHDIKVTYAIGVFCACAISFILGFIAGGAV